jgi:hypothetical protein
MIVWLKIERMSLAVLRVLYCMESESSSILCANFSIFFVRTVPNDKQNSIRGKSLKHCWFLLWVDHKFTLRFSQNLSCIILHVDESRVYCCARGNLWNEMWRGTKTTHNVIFVDCKIFTLIFIESRRGWVWEMDGNPFESTDGVECTSLLYSVSLSPCNNKK